MFKDFEIVVSDHSTDNTIKDICDKWSEKLTLVYVINDCGRGIISPNINNAMRFCTGQWIKILFQDDFLFNANSLSLQSKFAYNNIDCKWFMTTFYHSNTGHDFYRLFHPRWNDMIWTGNNTMGCPSGMSIINNNLIYFDENLNWLMDVDYYKRMFEKYGQPKILDRVTVVNRTSPHRLTESISQSVKDTELNILISKYA